MALKFNDANFTEEVLNSDKLAVVDVYADWCGPCRLVAPIIEELATEYDGKVKVGKLDADVAGATAQKYRVVSIPTILFFKGGQLVDQVVGAVPKATLKAKIDASIQRMTDDGTLNALVLKWDVFGEDNEVTEAAE